MVFFATYSGSGLSGLPCGRPIRELLEGERHHDVACLLDARGEAHVAVERDRGLAQDLADLAPPRRCGCAPCAAGVCPRSAPPREPPARRAGTPCCRCRASCRRRPARGPSAARRRTRYCRSPSPWRRRAGRSASRAPRAATASGRCWRSTARRWRSPRSCRSAPWRSPSRPGRRPSARARGSRPRSRAKANSAIAMTRPKNQSAFQNAVFMNSPLSLAARGPRIRPQGGIWVPTSYMAVAAPSRAQVDRRAPAVQPGELEQLRGDDEILHRHPLRLEQRHLPGRWCAPAGCRR